MMNANKEKSTLSLKLLASILAVILVALVVLLIVLESGNRKSEPNATSGIQESEIVDINSETTSPGSTVGEFGNTSEPWNEPGAKQPTDYTWDEFLKLKPEHQIAFQNTFASDTEFEAWMNRVMPDETENTTEPEVYPWEHPGAKQPNDYTWEEFLALTGNQQIAFQNAFGSQVKFEAWMERVNPLASEEATQPEETTAQSEYPWERPGAKKPEDYTWEEFLDLPGDLQIAFQSAFKSEAAFEAWMERVQPTEPEETESLGQYPWEQPGAKQPEEYTWEEFLSLPPDQQIAFQNAFDSDEAFEQWMMRVMPDEG